MQLTNLLNVSVELQIKLEKLPGILELREKMMTIPCNIHPLPFFYE